MDLHTAISTGQTDRVRTLLEMGADVEAKDNEGRTPLITESQYGRTETVDCFWRRDLVWRRRIRIIAGRLSFGQVRKDTKKSWECYWIGGLM